MLFWKSVQSKSLASENLNLITSMHIHAFFPSWLWNWRRGFFPAQVGAGWLTSPCWLSCKSCLSSSLRSSSSTARRMRHTTNRGRGRLPRRKWETTRVSEKYLVRPTLISIAHFEWVTWRRNQRDSRTYRRLEGVQNNTKYWAILFTSNVSFKTKIYFPQKALTCTLQWKIHRFIDFLK